MAQRGQFVKEYWEYKKQQGGQLSMKQYAALKKEQQRNDALVLKTAKEKGEKGG